MQLFGLGMIVCITVLGVLAIIAAIISAISENRKERLELFADIINKRFQNIDMEFNKFCESSTALYLFIEQLKNKNELHKLVLPSKKTNKGKSKK